MRIRYSLFPLVLVAFALVGVAWWLSAQTTDTRSTLSQAVTLYNEGRYAESTNLLSTIMPSDADYAASRCYEALCRFAVNDYWGYVQALDSSVIISAPVTAAVREDMAFKQIAALAKLRKFEDVFPRIQAYNNNFAGSERRTLVAEHHLSVLFERGFKKTQEACATGDTNVFNKRWNEGKANLEQFVTLASTIQLTNYHIPRPRTITEDLWTARIILGDEAAAFKEIADTDIASLEKLSLLRVNLNHKLQPANVNRNLELMREFIRQFPESASRPRVELDMAAVSFPPAKQLWQEAEQAELRGDASVASEKRAAARQLFTYQRSLQNRAVVNPAARIEAQDLMDLHEDLLTGYHLESDYASISSLTTELINSSQPGEPKWLLGKFFDGVVFVTRNPADLNSAARTLDEVLAQGFTGKPQHDHFVMLAAQWRFNVSLRLNDSAGLRSLYQQVSESDCTKDLKETFLKDYATLAGRK